MNVTVTYNAIAFVKQFDDAVGSTRQSIARGINTPDILTIKHSTFTDSGTKVGVTRHMVRFDQVNVDGEDTLFKNDVYLVLDISDKASTAQIAALLATFRAAVANVTAGDDILAAIQNGER